MDWIAACKIIEVPLDASDDQIKQQKTYWLHILHEDHLQGMRPEVIEKAKEALIEKKAAWEFLLKPGNRPMGHSSGKKQETPREQPSEKHHKESYSSTQTKPILEVTPSRIRFKDMAPNQQKAIVLNIVNKGGSCSKISISIPESAWIKIEGINTLNATATSNQITLRGIGNCKPGEQVKCSFTIMVENEIAKIRDSVNVEVELWMKSIDAEYHCGKGHAFFEEGDYHNAILAYNKAIKIDSRLEEAYFGRGCAYFRKGDYDKAISDFTHAIKINPKSANAYSHRGKANHEKGYYNDAVTDYTIAQGLDSHLAVKLNSLLVKSYQKLGEHHFCNGDYNKAIIDFTKLLGIDSHYAIAYFERGQANDEIGNYKEAIADYSIAIQLNPEYADGYFFRGIAYARNGDDDSAEADYKKAEKLGCTWKRESYSQLRKSPKLPE